MKKFEMKLGKTNSDRVNIYFLFVIFCYLIIIARLFFLQVIQREYYKKRSEENRIKKIKIVSPRGKIYDRNGKLLATNVAGYRLVYLNGRKYDDGILEEISKLLKEDKKEVEKSIKYGKIYRYTGENILEEDLEEEEAHKIIEKLKDYPYLDIMSYPKRKYLYGNLASHVLGYVKSISKEEWERLKDKGYDKTDLIGKKGIEKKYDEYLKGKDGYESIEVNAFNKIVKKVNEIESKPGKDLYLTLDVELQEFMTEYYKNTKASFIAMDAKTGEIIVAVSSPEYNLNKFTSRLSVKDWNKIQKDKNKPMQNRLTVGAYPPGSIFKPIVGISVLESGISPYEEVFSNGYYRLGRWTWRDWKRGGHGKVNLERSLIESVNTYYYTMGERIGHQKIIETASKFGIGKSTEIDIPEEKKGRLPDADWKQKTMNEIWYKGDTINLSIGQGYLLVTPIQMALVYDTLANNGIGYKPHFLKKIVYENSKETNVEPEMINNVDTKKSYYDLIKLAMEKVVTDKKGTARVLKTDNLRVAAKTGSAQNSQYKETHAWAAGFFPLENPEIIFISFVEGGGGGGSVAAPGVKAFIDKYLELKEGEKLAKGK